MRRTQPASGASAGQSEGPPWILGWRGAPREAPENTLASLRRALELALDGIAYDLRACAGGDLVLLADATLDRTSDARGLVAGRSLAELYGVDAGGWFAKWFAHEPIATFEEALALGDAGSRPQHVVVVHEAAVLNEIARSVRSLGARSSIRIASSSRSACVEARDLALAAMLLVERPSEDARRFVRDERIEACAARGGAWGDEVWPCERWLFGADDPRALLDACRAPINGVITAEPRRALAIRELQRRAPQTCDPYPLEAPALVVEPEAALGGDGQWCGAWDVPVRVRNPFDRAATVELALVVRRGAFEAGDLPLSLALEPQAHEALTVRLSGGSWSPGADPLLVASFACDDGARLVLDTTLERQRAVTLHDVAMRLTLLREHPGAPSASVHVRRKGSELLAAIENAGELEDSRLVVHLDGEEHRGARGLRVALPSDFDLRAAGVPFSIGIEGRLRDARGWRHGWRRWAGGLPQPLDAGAPGRLFSGSVR